MVNETQSAETENSDGDELETSGYVERTILHHLAGSSVETRQPSTVGKVLDDVAAVIERGDYANLGPNGAKKGTVRKSTIRRAFTQLQDKDLVQRVDELDPEQLQSDTIDLGDHDGDPTAASNYDNTADDARVTDWILTDEGAREIARLDARYTRELDEIAARYGRPRGETTSRVEA